MASGYAYEGAPEVILRTKAVPSADLPVAARPKAPADAASSPDGYEEFAVVPPCAACILALAGVDCECRREEQEGYLVPQGPVAAGTRIFGPG